MRSFKKKKYNYRQFEMYFYFLKRLFIYHKFMKTYYFDLVFQFYSNILLLHHIIIIAYL